MMPKLKQVKLALKQTGELYVRQSSTPKAFVVLGHYLTPDKINNSDRMC